jgi:hypothetical protein
MRYRLVFFHDFLDRQRPASALTRSRSLALASDTYRSIEARLYPVREAMVFWLG